MTVKKPGREDAAYAAWKKDLLENTLADPAVDAETKAALQKIADNELVGRKVIKGGMAAERLYEALDDIAAERKKLATEKAAHLEWYHGTADRKGAKAAFEEMQAELEEAQAELADREAGARRRPAADVDDDPQAARAHAKEQRELAELRNKVTNLEKFQVESTDAIGKISAGSPAFTAAFSKKMRKLAEEKLDFDEEEILNDILNNNTPIDLAAERHVGEQRKKRDADERKAEREKAKEEGRQEALTQTTAPDALRSATPFFKSAGTKSLDSKIGEARDAARKALAEFGLP